jgi:phage baseplate assembly protein W
MFREYAWDFGSGTISRVDGAPVVLSGLDALKVWIRKALMTPRYAHPAFSHSYGCEIERLVGSTYTAGAKASEAERHVTEALAYNPYILGVEDFEISADGDSIRAEFTARTVYGAARTVYGEVRANV